MAKLRKKKEAQVVENNELAMQEEIKTEDIKPIEPDNTEEVDSETSEVINLDELPVTLPENEEVKQPENTQEQLLNRISELCKLIKEEVRTAKDEGVYTLTTGTTAGSLGYGVGKVTG